MNAFFVSLQFIWGGLAIVASGVARGPRARRDMSAVPGGIIRTQVSEDSCRKKPPIHPKIRSHGEHASTFSKNSTAAGGEWLVYHHSSWSDFLQSSVAGPQPVRIHRIMKFLFDGYITLSLLAGLFCLRQSRKGRCANDAQQPGALSARGKPAKKCEGAQVSFMPRRPRVGIVGSQPARHILMGSCAHAAVCKSTVGVCPFFHGSEGATFSSFRDPIYLSIRGLLCGLLFPQKRQLAIDDRTSTFINPALCEKSSNEISPVIAD